jgi:hypothetical protein
MEGGRLQASRRTSWVIAILATSLVAGVYLVVWASYQGLAADAAVSVYHLPAYLSLVALLVWVILAASRAFRAGPGRRPWPLDDHVLLIGVAALVA